MQTDRATLCAHWLASSFNDFTIARDYRARIPSAACFHAQQGAEKALKALLVMVCGDAPRMHLAIRRWVLGPTSTTSAVV